MGLKQNVINAFISLPVRYVNFTFANRLISPMAYYFAASYVDSGRIRCATDATQTDRVTYDPVNDVITAVDNSFGERYWDEKSVLIHEGAHAILDAFYPVPSANNSKLKTMLVLDDETIAYLAGAIYLLAAKAPTPGSSEMGKPAYEAVKAAKPKVEVLMAKPWTGCDTMAFSTQDVKELQAAIKKHEFYKNDWNTIATHNGLRRSTTGAP